jgi:hypothetical protein
LGDDKVTCNGMAMMPNGNVYKFAVDEPTNRLILGELAQLFG